MAISARTIPAIAAFPLRAETGRWEPIESQPVVQELRRRVRLAELIHLVASAANEASRVEPAIRATVNAVCDFTGWPIGHAWLLAPDTPGALVPSGIWFLADPDRFHTFRGVSEAARFPVGCDLPGRVLQSGCAEWVPDVERDSGFVRGKWARDLGVRAAFAFPLRVGPTVVGVLEFFSPLPEAEQKDLLDVLGDVGAQLGRVVERQRAEEELARARDAALEASRLKSTFLANMSHEIRTPLNIILGYNSLIAERLPAASAERSLIDSVERAGHRLMGTIHGILDLSKIETRTFAVELAPLDLVEEVARQVEEHRALAEDKGLELKLECAEPDAWIRFDHYCLSSAVANLLQNAIKFTESGSIAVRLYRDEQFSLCLEVKDTGVGIDAAYLPKLFEPFSQEEEGYARRFEGSGLGLALTRKYLALNDAAITVESEKRHGSVFTVRFSKATELWMTEGLGGRPARGQSTFSGMERERPVVLVVEDDSDSRAYMKTLLRNRYQVLEATTGPEARRVLDEHADDVRLVLMDLSLRGEENGLAITAWLRTRNDSRRTLPVVAVTAHAFPEDRVRALSAGCNRYLAKPFKKDDLLRTMEELLGNDVVGTGQLWSRG